MTRAYDNWFWYTNEHVDWIQQGNQSPRMRQIAHMEHGPICVSINCPILRMQAPHASGAPSPNEEMSVGAHRYFVRV